MKWLVLLCGLGSVVAGVTLLLVSGLAAEFVWFGIPITGCGVALICLAMLSRPASSTPTESEFRSGVSCNGLSLDQKEQRMVSESGKTRGVALAGLAWLVVAAIFTPLFLAGPILELIDLGQSKWLVTLFAALEFKLKRAQPL
jgi:hypothetical protein